MIIYACINIMHITPPKKYHDRPRSRDPSDVMEVGYFRSEVDRTLGSVQGSFFQSHGVSIVHDTMQRGKKAGHLSILDAGCGTGRAMYELADELKRRGINMPLRLVGVSREDYSDESEGWRARKAVQDGTIGYAIANLVSDELPAAAFTVAYSYEVLVHINDVEAALRNIVQSVSPGGALYFNCLPEQAVTVDLMLAGDVSLSVDKRLAIPSAYDKCFNPEVRRVNYIVVKAATDSQVISQRTIQSKELHKITPV